MSKLINKSQVKKYALHLSQTRRGGKFTRVSREFFESIDFALRREIESRVHTHPSKGKTLK